MPLIMPNRFYQPRGAFDPAAAAGTPFTWNAADKGADITLANSNRDFTGATAFHESVRTTAGKTSGLWYCEVTVVSPSLAQPYNQLGIMNGGADVATGFLGSSAQGAGYAWGQQNTFNNTITVANAIPGTQNLANGDIVNIAMNLSNGKAWLGLNNSWFTGSPAADTSPWLTFTVGSDTWYFAAAANNTNGNLTTFRLASTATYSAPSGFTLINV